MTDFRALCAELAAELDHNRRCLLDDASVTHPLADRARTVLARWGQPPAPPAEGEVAELVAWLHGQDGGLGRRAIYARIAELLERVPELTQQLETERMRLAVCGVVAMSDTPESAAKARDCLPDYWSASADDIARQIDELMRLRARMERHAAPVPVPVAERDTRDPECVKAWPDCWDGGYDPRCCRFPKSCSCGLSAHALPLPAPQGGEVEP